MAVNFKTSETKLNLMRAFAGESQARNRYTFAAQQAKEQKLHVVEAVFTFTVLELLRFAQHNEYEEHDPVYQAFGDKAMEEGFPKIAASFHQIAKIEKVHGDRFGRLADLIEQNKLFISDVECAWMCLNCGHIFTGKEAPQKCPVCEHDRGFFIRLELAPYTDK